LCGGEGEREMAVRALVDGPAGVAVGVEEEGRMDGLGLGKGLGGWM
jgi:hypothetical protein